MFQPFIGNVIRRAISPFLNLRCTYSTQKTPSLLPTKHTPHALLGKGLARVGIPTGAVVSTLVSITSPLKSLSMAQSVITTPSQPISTTSAASFPIIPEVEFPPVVPFEDATTLTHRFVTKHNINGLLYDSIPATVEKIILIGDIHGCYDELLMLLKKAEFNSQSDIVVFLGDLVGKGKKSMQVLDFVINLATSELQSNGKPIEDDGHTRFHHELLQRCFVVKGNHEQYVISYVDYLADKAAQISSESASSSLSATAVGDHHGSQGVAEGEQPSSIPPSSRASDDTTAPDADDNHNDPSLAHPESPMSLQQRINNLINQYPVKSTTHLTVAKYCQYHLKEIELIPQSSKGVGENPSSIAAPEEPPSATSALSAQEQHEINLLKSNKLRYSFLNSMPYYISFPELELLCVHAGVIPDYIAPYHETNDSAGEHDHGRHATDRPLVTRFSRDAILTPPPSYDDTVQHPSEYNLLFMDGDIFLNMRNVKLRKRFRKDFKRLVNEYLRKTTSMFPQTGELTGTAEHGGDGDTLIPFPLDGNETSSSSSDAGEWSETDAEKPVEPDYFAPLVIRDESFQSKYKAYSHHKSGKIWSKSYSDYVKYQKAKNHDYSNKLRFPHIVFGHDAVSGLQFEDYATGLDTGCCYGRKLSALVFKNPKHPSYTPPSPIDMGSSLEVEDDGTFLIPRRSCHPLRPQLLQVDALDLYAPH